MAQKILIADDEFLIRWSLAEELSKQGYEVKAVEDGTVALESIRNDGYDFIITDLVMPGADGWEVLEEAKKMDPQAKVVIITAHGGQDTESTAKARGAYGYIEKPGIIDKVNELLKDNRSHDFDRSLPN